MFCTDKLRRLSKNNCSSKTYQLVSRVAQRTVRCHAGRCIGRTTLDGKHNLRQVCLLPLLTRDFPYQACSRVNTGRNSFANTAKLLDSNNLHQLACRLNFLVHSRMICSLAAKADNQNRSDIGI